MGLCMVSFMKVSRRLRRSKWSSEFFRGCSYLGVGTLLYILNCIMKYHDFKTGNPSTFLRFPQKGNCWTLKERVKLTDSKNVTCST